MSNCWQKEDLSPSHLLPSTFEVLYKCYAYKVYRQCLRIVKDADMAQDYTHDIFIKVFNSFDSFQHRSSYSSWLYSITYNYCVDQLHISKRLPISSWQADDCTDQSDEVLDDQWQEQGSQLVRQAMSRLSVQNQTLLQLKYEAGMSIDELARLYSLTPSAIKMRLKRSREAVKEHILINRI